VLDFVWGGAAQGWRDRLARPLHLVIASETETKL